MKIQKKETRIALFGTSADPPTYGHQALLEGLLTLFPTVITWASDNPIKNHGAPLEKRQKMLNALVQAISNPRLSLKQELSSPWTIETLDLARNLWPTSNLIFVIGSDLIGQIPKWVKAKEIMQKTHLGIAPREGWAVSPSELNALKSLGGHLELLPLKIPSSASSQVRNKTSTSDIPESILPILFEHNLYGLTVKKS